ncbi:MAG: SUMF1/EgtB/PvdO family nonheme iron enzyme [Bacteroidota bacterium]
MQTRQAHWSLVLVFGLLIGVPALKDFTPDMKKFKAASIQMAGFVFIPSGELLISETNKTTINDFYMFETEVTNGQYQLYLEDLRKQNKTEELAIAEVRGELWKTLSKNNQPIADHYFSHPAYTNYPVVNVTYQAAVNYCEWLSQQVNAKLESTSVKVRLPQKTEWIYAGRGGRDSAIYPWGGYYVQNNKGCYLANFNPQDEVNDDGGAFTVLASAYFPNDFGLYNISGNVAEMVAEEGVAMGGSWNTESYKDIRVDSESNYMDAGPTLGFRPVLSFDGTMMEKKQANKILGKAWKKMCKELEKRTD